MDTDGNVFFRRSDGGQIILQEFTSATGKTGLWTPATGQGDGVALDGKGAVPLTVNLTSSSSSTSSTNVSLSGGGSSSIAELNIQTQSGASEALEAIDSALSYVQAERSNLGAVQNRLTHTIDNLSNIVTTTSSAQSRIRDTDYAKETSELARSQIISQAANAMLAQANQQPQQVLQLLQ
jgi:flagellin